mgnify:FL=1
MFSRLTPLASMVSMQPLTSGVMTGSFQLSDERVGQQVGRDCGARWARLTGLEYQARAGNG